MVEVAPERPFSSKKSTPKLLAAVTPRVLPVPEFDMTPEVQRELDRFLTKDRATVLQVLERRSSHGEMLEKVFEGEGVPLDLLSVAAIESRFDPSAKSPAGARGMWQFMGSTARLYGLKVSGKVDERTDPLRSTVAAAKHLRDLFLSYNDWHLALAAYNAGIGTINKLLTRHGSVDFWQLARKGNMSGETARFVPKVIALALIVRDPDLYGFDNVA
jgi:membrane-bound lytic murein transglycosylase D